MECRANATLFVNPHMADWIFSNDVRKATVPTWMLNATGGVESDLTVSCLEGAQMALWEPQFQVISFIGQ
jgi:glycine cleavage system aminomethyltransferase T